MEVEQAQQQPATNEYVISAACIGNHVERNLIENNQAFQPINEYKVILCVWGEYLCGLPLIGHSMRVCAVTIVILVIRGVPYLSS